MMYLIKKLDSIQILMRLKFFIKITKLIKLEYKPKSEISDEVVEKIINHLN